MPKGNHTGPMGTGSMTGRGAGYCAGYGMPGYANNAIGRGFGGGFGRGGGRGLRFFGRGGRGLTNASGRSRGMRYGGYGTPYADAPPYQPTNTETEKQALNNQAEALQSELDKIKNRLSEMKAETTDE